MQDCLLTKGKGIGYNPNKKEYFFMVFYYFYFASLIS
jgi:hypothetical protein